MSELKAAQLVRDVPDFPKPGIMFKDITPLLAEPRAFRHGKGRDGACRPFGCNVAVSVPLHEREAPTERFGYHGA